VNILGQFNTFTPPKNSLAFSFLGQVGVAIRGPDGVIYIDPYLTDYGWKLPDGQIHRLPRAYPTVLAPQDTQDATAVLITHDHADHYDPETILAMRQTNPDLPVFGSYRSRHTYPNIDLTIVPALQPFELGSARVTPVPSAHSELNKTEHGYPCYGYIIEWNDVTIYHAGDTLVYGDSPDLPGGLPALLNRWKIDVAFLPANGGDYFRANRAENPVDANMNFRECVDLASLLNVRLLVPTHTDMFNFNTENLAYLVDYAGRYAPRLGLKIMYPGETHCHVNW
jgi:L-ascorbate 6-phosphate lactonase